MLDRERLLPKPREGAVAAELPKSTASASLICQREAGDSPAHARPRAENERMRKLTRFEPHP